MRKLLLTLCAALVAASSYAQWGPVNAVYLQGRMVCSTAPTNGQSLIWNTTYNCWTPTTATGGITAGDDVAWTGTHTFSLGATFGAASQLKWGSSGVTSPDVGFSRLLTTWLQVTNGSTGMGSLSLKNLNILRVDDSDYGQIMFGGTVGSEFSNDTYLGRPVAGRIDITDASGLGALAIDGLSIGATSTLADGKLSMTSVLNDATGNETGLSLSYTTNKASSGDDTGLQIVQTDTASPGTSLLIDARVASTSLFKVSNTGTATFSPDVFYLNYNSVASDGPRIYFNGSPGGNKNSGITNNVSSSASTPFFLMRALGSESREGTTWQVDQQFSKTNTSGTVTFFSLLPKYDQTSGTSANTDFLINRTETAVGSGSQLLIDAQVATASKFSISNEGKQVLNATLNDATGNEVAVQINGTTNKATSGNDTMLEIVQTDTASPGTSYLINAKVGATSTFSVDNSGNVTLDSGASLEWSTDTGLARSAAGELKVTDGGASYGIIVLDSNAKTFAHTAPLVDNTASDVLTISLAASALAGGTITYTITAYDGTDFQSESGEAHFAAVNKAGSYTTSIAENSTQAISSGTLTSDWAVSTGTNAITITLDADSSLSTSSFSVTYHCDLHAAAGTTVTKPTGGA